MFPYIIQGKNLTIVIDNTPHTVSASHIGYNKLIAAIKSGDEDAVRNFVSPKQVVINFGEGNVSIEGDKIFWKGREMHNALTKRMVAMIQEDFPVEPLVAFMENLPTMALWCPPIHVRHLPAAMQAPTPQRCGWRSQRVGGSMRFDPPVIGAHSNSFFLDGGGVSE